MGYAGFWKRAAAHLIDSFIYGAISWIVSFFVGVILGFALGASGDSVGARLVAIVISLGISLTVWAAYYAWPESSEWQATIGKHLMGLRVTDTNGQRISFWRAVWRNFAKIFSAIILFIGYMMCGWTERKQCLHDMMADCLVLDEHPGEKTGCVVCTVILFSLFAVVFFGGILAAIALPQYFKAVEKSRAAEAMATLSAVSQSQERYYMQTENYARTWNKLDVAPGNCGSVKAASCKVGMFTFELQANGVSATRDGDASWKYRLYRSYNSDSPRVKCEPLNGGGQSFCNLLE